MAENPTKSESFDRHSSGDDSDSELEESKGVKSQVRLVSSQEQAEVQQKIEAENKRRKSEDENEDEEIEVVKKKPRLSKEEEEKKQLLEMLTTRTGGAYIPPAKLRLMQEKITDKSSPAFQRLAWEALKKSINGLINKVNSPNIAIIVRELFAENVVRGRGLLCQSIMTSQTASPTFTHVYAALASIINTKFPNIGELLLTRLVLNFKRGFRRNDKTKCMASTRFVAHLVNQQVAHEVLALEMLTLLLETPTDDSVEVAIGFLKEVGQKLTEVSPRGIHAIFERLRHVLHESNLDKRTQYMIEVMFQVRKDGFKDNPAVAEELDLVEEEDQYTHMITLEDATEGQEVLNVFRHDTDYEAGEAKYEAIKKELLDEDDSSAGDGSDNEENSSASGDASDNEQNDDTSAPIIDQTETNMIALRRTIYLTIQSSLDFEETVHKLMKLNLKPGHEAELCHMVLDCCAQQRTYEKFFGLLAQRLCQIKRDYVEPFQNIFVSTYSTCHRLEIGKLRNVGKMFAHLLFTDAINWNATLATIHLNEHDTTSSSRIFIKILFQELAEYMGMAKLIERIRDDTIQEAFEGLFPRDDPANTRFAINFFTSIGLGGLTEDLRAHLKANPKPVARVAPIVKDDSDSSSSSSSSSSDSSSSSSSEEERRRRKKRKNKKKKGRKIGEEKERGRKSREEKEKSGGRRTHRREDSSDDDDDEGRKTREEKKKSGGRRTRRREDSSDEGRKTREEREKSGGRRTRRREDSSNDEGRKTREEREKSGGRRTRRREDSSDDKGRKTREEREKSGDRRTHRRREDTSDDVGRKTREEREDRRTHRRREDSDDEKEKGRKIREEKKNRREEDSDEDDERRRNTRRENNREEEERRGRKDRDRRRDEKRDTRNGDKWQRSSRETSQQKEHRRRDRR